MFSLSIWVKEIFYTSFIFSKHTLPLDFQPKRDESCQVPWWETFPGEPL